MHNGWKAALGTSPQFDAVTAAASLLVAGHILRGEWYVAITVGLGKGITWNETQDETAFPTAYDAAVWFVDHCGPDAVTSNVERLAL